MKIFEALKKLFIRASINADANTISECIEAYDLLKDALTEWIEDR